MEAWPMVAEERSVFAMFAPSELHACPDGFEQLLFGVFGLIRLEGHEQKLPPPAVAGGDVQTARADVSGFEVLDIIARGREGADAATIWLRVSRIRKGAFVAASKAGAGPWTSKWRTCASPSGEPRPDLAMLRSRWWPMIAHPAREAPGSDRPNRHHRRL